MSLALVAVPAFANEFPGPETSIDSSPAPLSRERARMNQRVFDRVWSEVRAQYYDPDLHGVDWNAARRTYRPKALTATDDRALYRSLRQMLALLNDDHAGAAPPAIARRQASLRLTRPVIGLTLRLEPEQEGRYVVEQVREGSPAADAGVLLGWHLETTGAGVWYPEQDVVEGQAVNLLLVDDEDRKHALVLTPRVMDPKPAFVADRSRDGVVVLRVEGFEAGLGRWMGAQLADLKPDDDVIIDLRGNPGGRLMEADAVLSCFLPADRVWATRTARSGQRIVLKTAGGCGDLEGPSDHDVAVLVDGQSRSAAELTPAALQEARRALVVGERTAGAVLISQDSVLPDGGRLTLSRSDFVTSGGVRLEKRGVTPDLAATVSAEDRLAGRDPALAVAIAALSRSRDEQALVQAAPAL